MPIPHKEVEEFYNELIKGGNVSDEQKKFLESLLSDEKNSNIFKSGVHGQRMINQTMDKLKKQEQEVKDKLEGDYSKKVKEIDDLRVSLAATATTEKKEIEKLSVLLKKAESDRLNIIQKAREYESGEDFLKEVGLTDPHLTYIPPTEPRKDDTKQGTSLTKEDILKEVGALFDGPRRALAALPFNLLKIQSEYKYLTGKDLDPDELLQKTMKHENGDYMAVYEKEYDIPNLRKQKQEAEFRARVDKEVAEKLQAELSKRTMLTGAPLASGSDFFKSVDASRMKEDTPQGVDNKNLDVIAEAVADHAARVAKHNTT